MTTRTIIEVREAENGYYPAVVEIEEVTLPDAIPSEKIVWAGETVEDYSLALRRARKHAKTTGCRVLG